MERKCDIEKDYVIKGRNTTIIGDYYTVYPNNEFNFPYLLFIPKNIGNNSKLIVSNDTPSTLDLGFDDLIKETINMDKNNANPVNKKLCSKFGYPLMIPIFPRLRGFNTIHFGREVFVGDTSKVADRIKQGKCQLSFEDLEKFKDIPKQLYLMVQDALSFVRELGYQVDDRVISTGYSSAGKTANLFTALYPEIVEIEISGGTGGLSIIPLSDYNGIKLNYPIGVNDIPNFNFEAYSKVRHFFYIGDDDYNDPALCKCEIESDKNDANGNRVPKRDENGSIIPIYNEDRKLEPFYDDMYDSDNISAIACLYGIRDGFDNQRRFDLNTKIYHELGINSVHKKYPGNHKTVFDNLDQIMNDVDQLIIEKNKTLK